MSLPTLLGYQRASAFVNATKLASQPLFSSDEEYKISNVLSNTFFIDIDHVSIAIHIVIVLSPSPKSIQSSFVNYFQRVLYSILISTIKHSDSDRSKMKDGDVHKTESLITF